jgi:hypothetical protein
MMQIFNRRPSAALDLPCLPKQNDLSNFLMSEECAEMARMVANVA